MKKTPWEVVITLEMPSQKQAMRLEDWIRYHLDEWRDDEEETMKGVTWDSVSRPKETP